MKWSCGQFETVMEKLEDVAAREEAERQQSLKDLEQLYEWLQQFEDPPPAPRPPPPYQFRNGSYYVFRCAAAQEMGSLLPQMPLSGDFCVKTSWQKMWRLSQRFQAARTFCCSDTFFKIALAKISQVLKICEQFVGYPRESEISTF